MNLTIRLTILAACAAGIFAQDFALRDTTGKIHTPAEWRTRKAIVLFFVTTDCPVGNSYIPEMNRIAEAYGGRHVSAYAVLADPTVSEASAARYATEYRYRFPVLLDPGQALVRLAGATVTPQAAVLTDVGKLLYLGRIDNRVEDFGKERPHPTRTDLRDVLDAVLASKPVPHSVTKSIGCAIQLREAATAPTFNADIAPILHEHCAVCHRPGEVAPFPLLTYQDAAKRAGLIATVTGKRYMPPWKPEEGYGHFQDERRLSDRQIELIRQWADKGAPEGDPGQRPSTPQFASGWRAGKPDEVFTMTAPFSVQADGPDVIQCFVVPLDLATDRYVKTVEFHPGNSRVVHHALFFLDSRGGARKLDSATPELGYPCFGGPRIVLSGALGGWAPGATPQPLASGMAFKVEKGTDLVMQIHYHPSGKPESDQSSVGLTFTGQPRKGLGHMVAGSRLIDLPAGDAHYEVVDWVEAPQDIELVNIAPHAHLLCKEVKVDARLPDGRIEPLIWIKDWDFNWQGEYRFAEPVKLPKGTRIEMRYVYDNSAANPRNPSNPPQRVTFGEQTTDEMALLFLLVALPRPEDAPEFRREFVISLLDQFLEGGEPAAMTPAQIKGLRAAVQHFDSNHNGKLEPEERTALLRFLKLIPK
jgi:peroxiredoxin